MSTSANYYHLSLLVKREWEQFISPSASLFYAYIVRGLKMYAVV